MLLAMIMVWFDRCANAVLLAALAAVVISLLAWPFIETPSRGPEGQPAIVSY
ncbi:MAG: hypothetical protein GY952_13890 [Rhodobacteraceae bacterium]|nr:hypothetical protein [Paracoccaceae bacterium]